MILESRRPALTSMTRRFGDHVERPRRSRRLERGPLSLCVDVVVRVNREQSARARGRVNLLPTRDLPARSAQ